jgi:hypothetical protein
LATRGELRVRPRGAEYFITEAIKMRNVITTMLASALLAGLTFGMAGCAEETGTHEEVKIKSKDGTTTETQDVKIKKTGDNPPAAPSEKP